MSIADQDEVIVRNTLRPKDAATLILVKREGPRPPRVLMGKRHANMVFQPNKFVFPGGRIDIGDQRIRLPTELRPHVAEKLCLDVTASRARGLALAAVRETFEETGILLGEPSSILPRTRAGAWQRFFAHGILPRLDVLELIGRAITPPNRTRRFDARFFMVDADAIGLTLDSAGSDELLEPCWLEIAEARALDLPSITRRMLDEVEARLADGAGSGRPIPFFRFVRGQSGIEYL